MNQNLMYFPCFAMLILTFMVALRMFILRVRAVRNRDVSMSYFKLYKTEIPLPPVMIQTDRHFINLFEAPVLFYMVCAFSVITFHVDIKMLGAAWLYVFFRSVQAFIHLTSNNVQARMLAYMFGWMTLLYMGLSLAYSIAS